ncbi:MAG: Na/Pi cotransporter family protein [Clostridia bacterium]|nr:Na/Pi cotransporter family protein [Clostridia bacterium]
MTITNVFTLLGGLAFFLFGMNTMGDALEKSAGNQLKSILGKLTSNKFKGFILGLVVTAVIQSSSATTVMVVGFVNSGIMLLSQAVGVIMGANLGTSVTAWILSLAGIESDNFWVSMLKPASFTPILAFIGIILYMFVKKAKYKDIGVILIGFAVLMFGMEVMSDAVDPLAESESFQRILVLFTNPVLGVIMGTVVTAVVQSSSASVGILQALTLTGSISYMTSIPIIMGQNIGTCVSAIISCAGANKNAKRAAFIHLYFNVIATVVELTAFYIITSLVDIPILDTAATPFGIAVVHTGFKIVALLILFPASGLLEKLALLTVRDKGEDEHTQLLDERLFNTPAVAIAQSRNVTAAMAQISRSAVDDALKLLVSYDEKVAERVRKAEKKADKYEDTLGDYLVKLSTHSLTDIDSRELSMQLHLIGDFERISDHALNVLESAEELKDKKMSFSGPAKKELDNIIKATAEIVSLATWAFVENDLEKASLVEPLEQVIDELKKSLKNGHIERLRRNECTIEQGFVFNDLITNLERVSDHCSNIAGCVIETANDRFDMHKYLRNVKKDNEEFDKNYAMFAQKYSVI